MLNQIPILQIVIQFKFNIINVIVKLIVVHCQLLW